MLGDLRNIRERDTYRGASVVLLFAAIGLPLLLLVFGDGWGVMLAALLIGAPAYVALLVATYRRLKDAALSGGWVMLMLIHGVGPRWTISDRASLYWGDFAFLLVTLVLAWFAPRGAGANPARPAQPA